MGNEVSKKAILVTIIKSPKETNEAQKSLDELQRLLETAGGEEFARIIQVKEKFDVRTCIGEGKVEELKKLCQDNEIQLVVFDFELSPAQIRNLEEDLEDVQVIDRSMLILDIFALHAVTGEGKLQVELAQLKYTAPRLVGKGKALSRLGGGIGTRGPGESKLETDKRHLHERISQLENQLEELSKNRQTIRKSRDRSGNVKIAIVGYTNAGKSTLLNALTNAGVLMEDKLFATLDPTTRKLELPSGETVYLTDTVGFIRKLPHHLIHAFQSTLEEAKYADYIWIVCDVNDPENKEHLKVTEQLLEELGAKDKQVLYVYNKCDQLQDFDKQGIIKDNQVYISAKQQYGLNKLLEATDTLLKNRKKMVHLLIPYDKQNKLSVLHELVSNFDKIEYMEDGVYLEVFLDDKLQGQFAEFIHE